MTSGTTLRHLIQITNNLLVFSILRSQICSDLYYTSSSDGIRHSLPEEIYDLTQDDARFMLIMCSAFVNYLKSKTSAVE
jgi:hypothetical protein